MGVDTKAYLRKNVSIYSVKQVIENKFNVKVELEISKTGTGRLFFKDTSVKDEKNNNRMLHFYVHDLSYPNNNQYPEGFSVVISIGCWGNSKGIIKEIVKEFSGWFIDSDSCREADDYGVFIEGKNPNYTPTEEEKLQLFIAKEFGHKHVDKINTLVKEAMLSGLLRGNCSLDETIEDFLENPYGE